MRFIVTFCKGDGKDDNFDIKTAESKQFEIYNRFSGFEALLLIFSFNDITKLLPKLAILLHFMK